MTSAFDLLSVLASDPIVGHMSMAVRQGRRVVARGSHGSSTNLLAGALAHLTEGLVVLVVAHLDDADEAVDELKARAVESSSLPALEAAGASHVSLDLLAQRLGVVRSLREGPTKGPRVLVCSIQSLMQGVPRAEDIPKLLLPLRRGGDVAQAAIVRWLDAAGYRRADAAEEVGDYAVRGGILDIFPPGERTPPVRLDFFGDTIERIMEIDTDSMASDREIDGVDLVCASSEAASGFGRSISALDLVARDATVVLHEVTEIVEQGRGYHERISTEAGVVAPHVVLKQLQSFGGYIEVSQHSAPSVSSDCVIELPVSPLPPQDSDAARAVAALGELLREDEHAPAHAARAIICCQNQAEVGRLGELIGEHAPRVSNAVTATAAYLHRGFVWRDAAFHGDDRSGPAPTLIVIPYHELLSRFDTRRRRVLPGRLKAGRAIDTFLDFAPGDYVVHRDHGIALFSGLRIMRPREVPRSDAIMLPGDRGGGAAGARRASTSRDVDLKGRSGRPGGEEEDDDREEFLTLEFAGGTRLHVPATKIDQVQKYVGGFRGKPQLSTLGGVRWKNQKEQVSESVRNLASEMLRIRAAREHMPGIAFPADTAWQREFEDEFPFDETEDQLAALAEIKRDMTGARPMDRLLCGDVGYGKTELAIRAAFKSAEFGKQTAVLVPTTVLAEQHERTFRSRFADYPFRIESLSRFKTGKEVNDTLAALRKGQIDIIIGTHRLLSKDVKFADLGVVIIDEEQRFGVEHKERLLALRLTVDVLTLSATPIPRTLHLSMLGLRDISSLATAPVERRAVVTEVIPYNEIRISRAIERELAREGQVFFVHNRVHNIRTVADTIQRLAPTARIVVGHGQMSPRELEDVMLRFTRREADVLVSTTIIESGIDIPTANTMIINDADRFGLADLHQLRGRVGRYKHRAYCYLLTPLTRNVTEKALKRLKAIEEFSMLGAGFKIAMRDLEIRGAGNILGPEQSGHIAAVGYDMYCQLLDRAVKELRNERIATPSETSIEVGISGLLPKAYIPSDQRRMEAYRRLAIAATPAELAAVEQELTSAYGKPPRAGERLIMLSSLRIAAAALGVRSMMRREKDIILRVVDPAPVADRLQGAQGTVAILKPKVSGEPAEVFFRPSPAMFDGDTLLVVLVRRLAQQSEHSDVST